MSLYQYVDKNYEQHCKEIEVINMKISPIPDLQGSLGDLWGAAATKAEMEIMKDKNKHTYLSIERYEEDRLNQSFMDARQDEADEQALTKLKSVERKMVGINEKLNSQLEEVNDFKDRMIKTTNSLDTKSNFLRKDISTQNMKSERLNGDI